MATKIDSTILLEEVSSCKLWDGCGIQLDYKYGMLTVESLKNKIAAMERCDDLTRDENQILAAYKRVIAKQESI